MESKPEMIETNLSPDLNLRPAKWDDLNAVAGLILDVCTADGDATMAVSSEDLARQWKDPRFELARDAWVVESGQGHIVGYEEFFNRYAHASLMGDGYVHPDFLGRGIGTGLLTALEARARREVLQAAPDLRVFIRNGMAIGDKTGRQVHEQLGYRPIRYSWRMEILLEAPPPAPHWPEGIELRPFDLTAQNEAVFAADDEAFRDHWGHTPGTFEAWQNRMTKAADFDPTLWHIAWDGEQIAGFSLCRYRMGIGWVGSLGVRRPWRKRGLGMALLLHSFGEFHRRGNHTVGLGVDAENPTGATRLYKRAGMHVAAEYVIYEKELRPGQEPQEDPAA